MYLLRAHRVIYDETLDQRIIKYIVYALLLLYCFRFEIVSLRSIIAGQDCLNK